MTLFVDLIHSYEMIKEEFVNVLMYSHIGMKFTKYGFVQQNEFFDFAAVKTFY